MKQDEAETREVAETPAGHAMEVTIQWSDGLHHRWVYKPDTRTWDLTLSGVAQIEGGPTITGYKRADMERVIGTALQRTAE